MFAHTLGGNAPCRIGGAVTPGDRLFQAGRSRRCSRQSPEREESGSSEASHACRPRGGKILKRTRRVSSQRCPLICNISSILRTKYCLFLHFLLSLVMSILGLLFLPLSPFAIQEFKTSSFHNNKKRTHVRISSHGFHANEYRHPL